MKLNDVIKLSKPPKKDSEGYIWINFNDKLPVDNVPYKMVLMNHCMDNFIMLIEALQIALPCVEYAEIDTGAKEDKSAHNKCIIALEAIRNAIEKANEVKIG